ncbi:hypothetical protein VKS41_003592 [Umbelopsis sp. WA50703]
MDALASQYDTLLEKQQQLNNVIPSRIDSIRELLLETKKSFENDPSSWKESLVMLEQRNKKNNFQKELKEYSSSVSKYGKAIEKTFKQDPTIASDPTAFAGKEKILDRAVALHFIRQGQFELSESFIREAGMTDDEEIGTSTSQLKEQFREMHDIMKELKAGNTDAAIKWATEHHDGLQKRGSSLEFQLHRLKFIKLLGINKMEALYYGRTHFDEFADRHMSEIRRLMTSLIYHNKLSDSPYADFMSTQDWVGIKDTFQRDFCALLDMSADSPLYISVLVGTMALPTIIKVVTIMNTKRTEWSQQDELPVEIPLPDDLRFHSVFACPVSKEQATAQNPPMMMPCGHVICKESLTRLSKSSRNSTRFKCPYCPSESSAAQATPVYF